MSKKLSYLAGALLGISLLATPIGIAAAKSRNSTAIEKFIPVQTRYDGKDTALRIPVYRNIKPSQCSKYARNVAQQVFGEAYNGADAWNLQYHNRVIAQVGNNSLESLADREVLKPGMMVGVYNPSSKFNDRKDEKGKKAEYTHVVLYIGDDPKTSEPLFVDQFGKKIRIQTEKQLKRTGLAPREILKSKN